MPDPVNRPAGSPVGASTDAPGPPARRTKIVVTLGPETASTAVLRRLFAAGMDVARLNFSHGTRAEHGRTIRTLRRLARERGTPLAILQDLRGPKIRVGALASPVRLVEGTEVTLTAHRRSNDHTRIPIVFPRLPQAIRRGGHLFMQDGTIELQVRRVHGPEVRCRVLRGGTLAGHQGLNLPGTPLPRRALTRRDAADLRFGLRHGVDWVALSFVRSARDLRRARRLMRAEGRIVPIVAKLETAEAIARLDEIVAESDAVMVARGDLGVELPPEQVPLLQKDIIRRANARGIPAITATQMLESMVHQDQPTRAETSDVANAILDGTDAVMLSEETATGRHPVEAVQMMARIALAVEAGTSFDRLARRPPSADAARALAAAARDLAAEFQVAMIIVLTTTGRSACLLSELRPPAPVLACTEDEHVARRLGLYWGVHAIVIPFQPTTDAMIPFLDRALVRRRLARPGDPIVIVGSVPVIARGRTNYLQLHRVGRAPAGRRRHRGPHVGAHGRRGGKTPIARTRW